MLLWIRQLHPIPVLLPGKSHGRRSLKGCSPWGRWGSDTTERLHFHFSLSCIGEGNGSVLAWRIPGTGEPGGLPSLGLHRVGHDWSDLAAYAVNIIALNICLLCKLIKGSIKSCIWLHSFLASGSFQMSQFLTSRGQRIGVSASASVLPMNIQDWYPLGWTGLISLQSKGLSTVFSNTTVQKHQFFGTQLSL